MANNTLASSLQKSTQLCGSLVAKGAGRHRWDAESATKAIRLLQSRGRELLCVVLASLFILGAAPASIGCRYREYVVLTFLGTFYARKQKIKFGILHFIGILIKFSYWSTKQKFRYGAVSKIYNDVIVKPYWNTNRKFAKPAPGYAWNTNHILAVHYAH